MKTSSATTLPTAEAPAALAIVEPPNAAISVMDSPDAQMGAQLTAQYKLAVDGARHVVRFGAMCVQIREELRVDSTRGANSAKRGPDTKGTGFKGWLAQYAPNVPESSAIRYMGVAEAVQECCKLPSSIKNSTAEFVRFLQASPDELDEKLRPKQLALWEEIDGSSQNSWMDRLKARKSPGGNTSKHKPKNENLDPNDPESEARDIWAPIGEELEKEGLVEKSWANLSDADRSGLFRIVEDLYKELKAAGVKEKAGTAKAGAR